MLNRSEKLRGPKLAFCASLTLLLLAAACGPTPPPDTRAADVSALRDLDAQWSKTAGTRDLDATVAYYSDDAALLPPDAPIVNGKQAILSGIQSGQQVVSNVLQLETTLENQ